MPARQGNEEIEAETREPVDRMPLPIPDTAAEALLMRMKACGIDYLFANGGTDFAPIIEAFARGSASGLAMPEPVVVTHETAAVAMAHGYYLATGRPQAVMVHVNVGLANSVMGLINAASENIPLFMLAGRTPITEFDRTGARMTPIQYGQEMRDQAALVRESVKWDYELRYPEQAALLVDRALSIAMSEPRGPVYLGLPREPLAEAWPGTLPVDGPVQAPSGALHPDPGQIAQVAELVSAAEKPLIVVQRSDPGGDFSRALSAFANDHAIQVAEFRGLRNVLASRDPMASGSAIGPLVKGADLVIVIDAPVPWIQRNAQPADDVPVVHIGPDPHFSRMPVRSFRTDIAIKSSPLAAIEALAGAMEGEAGRNADRHAEIAGRNAARLDDARSGALAGNGSPMTPAFVAACLSDALGENDVVFSELGAPLESMDLKGPNAGFTPPFSGGLGWGVPAALGAALADRERVSVASVGEGSYIFANPVACHQVAEALELPLLTVVSNNGIWNAVRRAAVDVYPEGQAARMNRMPITSLAPVPDCVAIAKASRGWARSVERGDDLPGALAEAMAVARREKRQALLEVRVSY